MCANITSVFTRWRNYNNCWVRGISLCLEFQVLGTCFAKSHMLLVLTPVPSQGTSTPQLHPQLFLVPTLTSCVPRTEEPRGHLFSFNKCWKSISSLLHKPKVPHQCPFLHSLTSSMYLNGVVPQALPVPKFSDFKLQLWSFFLFKCTFIVLSCIFLPRFSL